MNPAASMLLVTVGVASALAGREIARNAAENEMVWRAFIGLGLMIVGTVAVFLAIHLAVALEG